MMVALTDIDELKTAYVVFCENAVATLSRLKNDFPTLCQPNPDGHYSSDTASIVIAAKELAELRLRLMAQWGILPSMVAQWMGLGLEEYKKRMDPSIYTVYRSDGSSAKEPGRTKKSRKSGGSSK
jgi:hypothetical protein